MTISQAHAFLIHPGKLSILIPVSGKTLNIGTGKLFDMLNGIFSSEPSSRDFDVMFNSGSDGKQVNACRDLMIKYQNNPNYDNGLAIANRLQKCTDNRSGIGLLFLMSGNHGLNKRLVVSRFPTDQAILAEVDDNGLDVEFLEQVFIKRLSAYKALLLDHQDPSNGYWSGTATDRQAGGAAENISDYWLTEFLEADFAETPAAGTQRLAGALKRAIKSNPNIDVKSEIAAASSLAGNAFAGKTTSIKDFCAHFGFSISTTQSIQSQLSKPSLFDKQFKFDANEFKVAAPLRTVELNTGAILTAPNENFDKVFEKFTSPDGNLRYTTVGKIKDQRISK